MKNNLLVVYDDSCKSGYDIENIIGDKSFGNIIYKRKTLKERYFSILAEQKKLDGVLELDDIYGLEKLNHRIEELPEDTRVVHLFSDYVVRNQDEFGIIMEKAQYVHETVCVADHGTAVVLFDNSRAYENFLKIAAAMKSTKKALGELETQTLSADAFWYMNDLSHFVQYMTGGFEARFFNALHGDEYTVTKTSTNKVKIKSEYQFYQFLPEDMKSWFVLPYNYEETEDSASYTMERLHMTDVAIRWIHGAISPEEFTHLLQKIFYFVNSRKSKDVTQEQYQALQQSLYVDKVRERIGQLKKSQQYETFASYIRISTDYDSIDDIVADYETLYAKAVSRLKTKPVSVIGHGDLCFSNMLYNKDTFTLKLIDTKGALKEEDIWTNPYYDLAKLSHSICGRYDFFNSGMYEIRLEEDMKFHLTVEFDNSAYITIFREFLEKAGYDYQLTRIFEASLFLSMLPLHMDNPQKVFGFILNAIHILEDIKANE